VTVNAESRFYWAEHANDLEPRGWARLSDNDFHEVKGRTESTAEPAGPAARWAYDFLLIARAVFAADKKALRRYGDDGWTRTIQLCIPVLDLDLWRGAAGAVLHELLTLLTADRWNVSVRARKDTPPWPRSRLFDNWSAEQVALLSGGLDSTALAADLVAKDSGDILFYTFYDPKMKRPQDQVFAQIKDLAKRPVHRRQISQTVQGGGKKLEPTSRSRGLLYAAVAVYAAAAHQVPEVLVPENGQLAINPPLTPGRLAACSSRSVHPRTLDLINTVIRLVGGAPRVVNPLIQFTKGEVCLLALQAGLEPKSLFGTVSCGHPPIKHREPAPYHCGYCFPCLVRQSGLWHALQEDNTGYQIRPWQLPFSNKKTQDLKDLQSWLNAPFTLKDLVSDTPLPAGTPARSLMPVIDRSRAELTDLLEGVLRGAR
jgi:7-cyano-7-deazaguanine synthase in queuosine biosynthesis